MIDIAGHIILYLILGVGVLLTSLGAPGTWLILVASGIYGWITRFQDITIQTLGILAGIALLLEVIEFLLAVKLAEKMGAGKTASWAAVIGAILGGIWGTAILPLIGSLVGALSGAFLGAVIWEVLRGKPANIALKSGRGALIGRGGATIAKTIGAMIMVVIVVFA